MPEASPAYPGDTLGLPKTGLGSLAPMSRRLAALMIDWLIAYGPAALGLAAGIFSEWTLSRAVLVIWFLLGVVALRLFGFTPGQLALGLRVVALDERLGLGRVIVRGLLVALVIPALFTDWGGRGIQERITNTAVVRR